MHTNDGPYEVWILDEPAFTPNSADNLRSYNHEYILEPRGTSRHGIECRVQGKVLGSAIVIAGGGATGVHDRSLIADRRRCFVAVGDHIACLQLPDLGGADIFTEGFSVTTTHAEATDFDGRRYRFRFDDGEEDA